MCPSEDARKVTALVLHRMKNNSNSTSLEARVTSEGEGKGHDYCTYIRVVVTLYLYYHYTIKRMDGCSLLWDAFLLSF